MDTFIVGQRITVTVTFRDANGTLFDPATVEFRVRNPSRTDTVYEHPHASITNPSDGIWKFSYLISDNGQYYIVAASTTTNEESVSEITFMAIAPHV